MIHRNRIHSYYFTSERLLRKFVRKNWKKFAIVKYRVKDIKNLDYLTTANVFRGNKYIYVLDYWSNSKLPDFRFDLYYGRSIIELNKEYLLKSIKHLIAKTSGHILTRLSFSIYTCFNQKNAKALLKFPRESYIIHVWDDQNRLSGTISMQKLNSSEMCKIDIHLIKRLDLDPAIIR